MRTWLKPQFWLELQSLGDVGRLGALEDLRVKHVHERRCFAAHRLAACGRDDHLVDGQRLFLELKVDFEHRVGLRLDLLHGLFVADEAGLDGQFARGQVLEHVVTRGVGGHADGGAVDYDVDVGQVFARLSVDHVAGDDGVCLGFDLFRSDRGISRAGPDRLCERCAKHQQGEVNDSHFLTSVYWCDICLFLDSWNNVYQSPASLLGADLR